MPAIAQLIREVRAGQVVSMRLTNLSCYKWFIETATAGQGEKRFCKDPYFDVREVANLPCHCIKQSVGFRCGPIAVDPGPGCLHCL